VAICTVMGCKVKELIDYEEKLHRNNYIYMKIMQAVILYLPINSVRTGRCIYHVAMHLPCAAAENSSCK